MYKVVPVHLFQGMSYLDIMNLEEKLAVRPSSPADQYLFIDLSQVRFAELNGIAKLVLDIEAFVSTGITIYIALPTIHLTTNEQQSINYSDTIKRNILKARVKANNFLKTVGFVNVLREISSYYSKEIYISELFDFESTFNVSAFDRAFSSRFELHNIEYYDYRYVFPLERLHTTSEGENFNLIEKRLDKILENKERGLESIDVQGIKNVILSELLKNVSEHAHTEFAIFTIGLISTKSLLSTRAHKKTNPIERNYLQWLKENEIKSQVEIYFGDAGIGILNRKFENKFLSENDSRTRSKEEQLKWAFQKWSTLKHNEPRRGTKGLYRIQRIVNKYNGLFHITTGSYNGGFQKGGLSEPEWLSRKSPFYSPGTFIQIKMCPYAEVKDFRFTLKKAKSKGWKTVQYVPRTDPNFIDAFIEDIKKAENLLVILDIKDMPDAEAKGIIEKALPEFSFYSHPAAVVIYLLTKLRNDTIQIIAESANEYILSKAGHDVFQESQHRDTEEVYDPVLIIGEENTAFWYGGNQHLINLLNESYSLGQKDVKVSALNSYKTLLPDEKIRIRIHLENDNRLVVVDSEGKLSFNFTNIDSLFEQSIIENVGSGSLHRFCSPKLEIVDNWLDVRSLLHDNVYGYALTMYLKFKNNIENLILDASKSLADYYILIDHNQQKQLAVAFATLLGISNKNIKVITEDVDPKIPRRTKLFPEKSQVIILTTIISSSETIRRLVKFVRRDSGFPIVILALCNYRKYNIHQLETWNEVTPILSIYQKNKIEQAKLERDIDYFSKKHFNINTDLDYISPNFTPELKIGPTNKLDIQKDLRTFIVQQKAIHFNHIGIFKHRHFTFYLDKDRLLNSKSIIWEWFERAIKEWKVDNQLKSFTIYVSTSLVSKKGKSRPFFDFLHTLSSQVETFDQDTEVYLDKNIVFIEFGVMTGKTINDIIVRSKQVKRIFMCILFDQSLNGDFNFYERINSLNNLNQIDPAPTEFKIAYLADLPLGFYTSTNCPICEHTRALDYYKISLRYMYDFSEDRQNRLKLIDAHELRNVQYPHDFYYTEEHPDHELSSELIVNMFELKMLLDRAETSTQRRIELYNLIFDAYSNFDSYLSDSNSIIYSLVYYLSNEINWLQKEPLVFRDFRDMLAEISLKICTMEMGYLASKIEISNVAVTTPVKLAVRYKYAAISLLRSTNKLKFCQSLSQIVLNSMHEGQISNNLLQNTFYHILSLFKNKYNRSASYNHAISEQLELLVEKKIFSEGQKAVIKFLLLYNNFFYTATDLKVIKSLKKEYAYFYADTNHPDPETWMSSLDLSEFPDAAVTDLMKNKEQSTYYVNLLPIAQDLEENWMRVHSYIYANIQVHTEFLTDAFKNSTFFQELFFDDIVKNIFDGNYLLGKTDDFSTLISEISKRPLIYVHRKGEYDSLHRKINHDLIDRKSKFAIFLLAQFPSDIVSIVRQKYSHLFPKLQLRSGEYHRVFYPATRMKMDFDLILQNINKRLSDGVELKDVLMEIEVKEEQLNGVPYTLVDLCYNGTDQKNNEPRKEGALSRIQKEIQHFGGAFTHDEHTDNLGYFHLSFKFIKYE